MKRYERKDPARLIIGKDDSTDEGRFPSNDGGGERNRKIYCHADRGEKMSQYRSLKWHWTIESGC